jgi:hypothetical protein
VKIERSLILPMPEPVKAKNTSPSTWQKAAAGRSDRVWQAWSIPRKADALSLPLLNANVVKQRLGKHPNNHQLPIGSLAILEFLAGE